MVDYETFCRIRDHLVRQQLTVAQTARALGLDVRTVARWADVEQFRARKAVPRASKLDAFKGQTFPGRVASFSPGTGAACTTDSREPTTKRKSRSRGASESYPQDLTDATLLHHLAHHLADHLR